MEMMILLKNIMLIIVIECFCRFWIKKKIISESI